MDQVFTHRSLWGTFHIPTTALGKNKYCTFFLRRHRYRIYKLCIVHKVKQLMTGSWLTSILKERKCAVFKTAGESLRTNHTRWPWFLSQPSFQPANGIITIHIHQICYNAEILSNTSSQQSNTTSWRDKGLLCLVPRFFSESLLHLFTICTNRRKFHSISDKGCIHVVFFCI